MIRRSETCEHYVPVRFMTAVVAGAALIAGSAVAQRPMKSEQPIVIDSAVSNIDDAAKTAEFTTIRLTQGNRQISADRASAVGVGFQNGRWTFAGRVLITMQPGASLWADQAVFEYRDGELVQATATGSPAHFEQRRSDSEEAKRGQADEIKYDAKRGTVQLRGHAQLITGQSMEVNAPVFIFHIQENKWQAYSENGTPTVHATIHSTSPLGDIIPQNGNACSSDSCK